MGKILVIDDERKVLSAFEETLRGLGHEVSTACQAETGLEQLRASEFDVVILDIRMPGMDGLQALEQIKSSWPRLPVIVMTGHGTMETAIEATKRGAFDYQLKPFQPAEMVAHHRTSDARVAGSCRNRVAFGLEPAGVTGETIVGRSDPMQAVYKAIGRVAPTDATVLIRGESGTGKELVAAGHLPAQPALRAAVAGRQLRCHSRGVCWKRAVSDTNAGPSRVPDTRRIGKLEQADGATLFLDEIGDIPLSVQAKILRVLQEGAFSGWAATRRFAATCASSRRRTVTLRRGSRREPFERTSITG